MCPHLLTSGQWPIWSVVSPPSTGHCTGQSWLLICPHLLTSGQWPVVSGQSPLLWSAGWSDRSSRSVPPSCPVVSSPSSWSLAAIGQDTAACSPPIGPARWAGSWVSCRQCSKVAPLSSLYLPHSLHTDYSENSLHSTHSHIHSRAG